MNSHLHNDMRIILRICNNIVLRIAPNLGCI